MKIHRYFLSLLLLLFTVALFSGCDDDVESMSWRPGSSLHIIGSDAVEAGGDEEAYYVDGFTVKENYEWKLNNTVIQPARSGEFVYLSFPTAGQYVLTVSNGRYTGTLNITAE